MTAILASFAPLLGSGSAEEPAMKTRALVAQSGGPSPVINEKVPLGEVANSFRQLPSGWITPDGLDVTDDFVRYAKPLIGEGWPEIPVERGLQRFARLEPSFVPSQLAKYVPQSWR
jgi:6-phosphofructokinase 1